MERKIGLTLILSLVMTACGPSGFPDPISSVYVTPKSTYVPPTPEKSVAGKYEYFQGLSKFSNVSLAIDGNTRKAELRGEFVLNPANGGAPFNIQFDIQGTINDHYVALLRPSDVDTKTLATHKIEIGAKLTCLYTDCSDSFIDVYIRHNGEIYHHQVEAQGRRDGAATSHRQEVKPEPKSSAATSTEAEQEEDETESENETTPDSSESGYYVGTRESDIKEIFIDVVSAEEVKTKDSDDAQIPAPKTEAAADVKTPVNTPPKPPVTSTVPVKTVPAPAAPRPLPKSTEPVFTKRDTSVPSMPETTKKFKMQAYGKPDGGGRLVNATDLLEYTRQNSTAGFGFMNPGRRMSFGTDGMLDMLVQLGKYAMKFVNGYELRVGDVSAQYGGRSGHTSHQNGLDADIEYFFGKGPGSGAMFKSAVASGRIISDLQLEEQWKLFKFAVKSEKVNFIFVDSAIKKSLCEFATKNGELQDGEKTSNAYQALRVINPWKGHHNHFHLRIRNECPANEPRCFQMMLPPNVTNCK